MNNLLKIALVLLFVFTTLNLVFFLLQTNVLFFPDNTDIKNCEILKNPQINFVEQEVNGEKIRYLIHQKENALGNLILFHGNAGNACHRYFYMQGLKETPVNVILAEYPGYGGHPILEKSQKSFLKNAQAVYDHVETLGLPILLYGESLGTAMATYLAAQNKVSGILLNNPFTSITDLGNIHYPYLLINLLNRNPFPSKNWAKNVSVSPIIFQGDSDKIISLKNVKAQVTNFKIKPELIIIKFAGHNDLMSDPQVFKEAKRYINSVLKESL